MLKFRNLVKLVATCVLGAQLSVPATATAAPSAFGEVMIKAAQVDTAQAAPVVIETPSPRACCEACDCEPKVLGPDPCCNEP
jgi:hypothetical protein